MGMSSSQARLLSLTARMHDIEYKAQRIEAQKLQLANDSSRVYEDYIRILDAKKVQYKALTTNGTVTYLDANMNIMQNGIIPNYTGEHSNTILFLQNQEGKIMVTPTVAAKFGLTATGSEATDMVTYIHDVTGKDKIAIPVYRTEYEDDTTKIVSFTPIANTLVSSPSAHNDHTGYTPVENEVGGVDYDALKTYAEFHSSHSSAPSGATALSDAADITAGGNYTISTADELQKLLSTGNATNTAGTTFTLTNDIDLSGINWTGIQNFAGTFDGNGYVISNLTGSQGLFASTDGATIMNVGLKDVNVTGNSSYVGGLIGLSTTTSLNNCYVTGNVVNSYSGSISDFASSSGVTTVGTGGLVGCARVPGGKTGIFNNVYSAANVTANNSDGVGGLIGSAYVLFSNGKFDITNAYAVGTISGKNGVGGFIGAMYNDEDNASDVTDIIHCYSGGTVNGNDKVGGFFGSYLYWGDNSDISLIQGCSTTSNVNGNTDKGAFAGHLWVKMNSATAATVGVNYLVNFKECGYLSRSGLNAYGTITNQAGSTTDVVDGTTYNIDDLVKSTDAASGLVEYQLAGSIPSINSDGSGAYMSNILGVFNKAGLFDSCDNTPQSAASVNSMKYNIANFLSKFQNTTEDNKKLWYLNTAICNYINNGSNPDLAQKLYNDVVNGTTTQTESYQAETGEPLSGSVKHGAGEEWTVSGNHDLIPGVLNIPSINTIADEIYYAMKKEGYTTTQSEVRTWFNNQFGSLDQASKITLANINEMITNGSNLTPIFNAIPSGTYTNSLKYNTPENPWTINVNGSDQAVSFTYGQKPVEVFDHNNYEWDMTDPDIINAIAMWGMSQRGVIIVEEEQAASKEYLVNVLEAGFAVLTTFDPAAAASLTPEQIQNMTDDEYNKVMKIVNTSVAVNTSVQEVADEKELKKAEAKYEADMKRIDMKDRKYDSELAKYETERNAVKQEIDTLKNVAKDNVDRTFKLFS